jgi:hypothetical protein
MRTMRFAVLITSLAIVSACEDPLGEDAVLAPIPPLAYTRFVNGVADTGSTDWRFIDILEYSPTELGMRFRDFSPYAGTATGTHTLRIFPTSTDINITQNQIIEAQVTLEAGKYYTILHTGYADAGRTPADQVIVYEDQIPTVAAGNIAARFINAGIGLPGQDTYAVASATTTIAGATPIFTNIAYGAQSTYNSSLAVGPMAFRAANTGTTTVQASALSPVGSPANAAANLTAVGGHTIPLSVMTGILFPASVTGTSARSFTSAGVVWIVDRHPN